MSLAPMLPISQPPAREPRLKRDLRFGLILAGVCAAMIASGRLPSLETTERLLTAAIDESETGAQPTNEVVEPLIDGAPDHEAKSLQSAAPSNPAGDTSKNRALTTVFPDDYIPPAASMNGFAEEAGKSTAPSTTSETNAPAAAKAPTIVSIHEAAPKTDAGPLVFPEGSEASGASVVDAAKSGDSNTDNASNEKQFESATTPAHPSESAAPAEKTNNGSKPESLPLPGDPTIVVQNSAEAELEDETAAGDKTDTTPLAGPRRATAADSVPKPSPSEEKAEARPSPDPPSARAGKIAVRVYDKRISPIESSEVVEVGRSIPRAVSHGPIHPYFQRFRDRKEFFVREGDTLENIAYRLYQNEKMAARIAVLNQDSLKGGTTLTPGTRLRLP